MPRRVLFIQHAGVMGGSVISLGEFLQSLRNFDYEVKVCLLNPDSKVVDYYSALGIPTFINRKILPFPHTAGSWLHLSDPAGAYLYLRGLAQWSKSVRETKRVVTENPCDLVHLNSSILLPSAFALREMGCRFVWHVRESPQPRYWGNRLRFFRKCLTELPNERVFLSASDRMDWMGSSKLGAVIPHGVQAHWFVLSPRDIIAARDRLGIPATAKCVLYLGGFMSIKGIFVLLQALALLARQSDPVFCLMPGTQHVRGNSLRSKLGRGVLQVTQGGTDEMKSLVLIKNLGLDNYIRRMPFTRDLGELFQAADALVFPAIVPHFAVPVIEAAAAAKPVIVSDYPAMRELIQDQETGILVPPGNVHALAESIQVLLSDQGKCRRMGSTARARALDLRSVRHEVNAWIQIYDRISS